MKAIPVDLEELGSVLYGGINAELEWYLDLRTGELLPISADFLAEMPQYKNVAKNPETFLPIGPLSSKEGFLVMEDFVDTLPEGEARRSLERALRLPKPFRSFKDTLMDFPEVRAAWFDFEHKRHRETAGAFLEENKIEWSEPKTGG